MSWTVDSRNAHLGQVCSNQVNKDGLLSDSELNDFQLQCFATPLQQSELSGIKSLVLSASTSVPPTIEEPGIVDDSLTEAGFLWLQTHFIQKGRLETTWKVLRTFGYGEDLALRENFLYPRLDIPSDCTAELSSQGNRFLTELFEKYDKVSRIDSFRDSNAPY